MIGWVLLAVYVIGWAGFSVTIARFAQQSDMKAESTLDAAMLVMLSMVMAMVWPLVIPGGWVYKKVFGKKEQEL